MVVARDHRRFRKLFATTSAARRLIPPRRRYREGAIVEAPLDGEAHGLEHALHEVLIPLGQLRTRRALDRDARYRGARDEIDRVLAGFEWDLRATSPALPAGASTSEIRAVAWNVERGKRFDALMAAIRDEPVIAGADLLLLTELDIGMGRSGNRNVPREVARRLGKGYVFANYHLVLAPGDSAELDVREPNAMGIHGAALLTRWPVRRAWAVGLPEYTDKFHAIEKRLGTKRALLCEVAAPDGPLAVAVLHLDPFAPPAHRANQLRSVLAAVERMGTPRVLIGGDFNTNTYHLGSKIGLGVDIAHKLARFGFAGTIEQYMTPEQVFERRVFGVLAAAGFATQGFTDPHSGTILYDLRDPEVREKSRHYLPGFAFRWLERKLRRWDGCVPMRIDYFAGRGLRPLRALTLPRDMPGGRVSDHAPIVLEFTFA